MRATFGPSRRVRGRHIPRHICTRFEISGAYRRPGTGHRRSGNLGARYWSTPTIKGPEACKGSYSPIDSQGTAGESDVIMHNRADDRVQNSNKLTKESIHERNHRARNSPIQSPGE